MIYVEVRLKDLWDSISDRKECWSYILSWIGTCSLVMSCVFSYILACMKPRQGYKLNAVRVKRASSVSRTNISFDKEVNISNPVPGSLVQSGGAGTMLESAN